MKCQILFSRNNKKNISKCRLLIFYPACKVLNVWSMELVGDGDVSLPLQLLYWVVFIKAAIKSEISL